MYILYSTFHLSFQNRIKKKRICYNENHINKENLYGENDYSSLSLDQNIHLNANLNKFYIIYLDRSSYNYTLSV